MTPHSIDLGKRYSKLPGLWNANAPRDLWLCQSGVSDDEWQVAAREAAVVLELRPTPADIETLLALVLGEERFGKSHFRLGFFKRLYYIVKPLLPRVFIARLRMLYGRGAPGKPKVDWPIEARYVKFQWEVIRNLLKITGRNEVAYTAFWPHQSQFAFVLTHDVETADGQAFVRAIADLEEQLGYRSSFNFVLEGYPLDRDLMRELVRRGFEVGCHGLRHDGKLFTSRKEFGKKASRINTYLKAYDMVGFRSPLTLRNPEWMQDLQIDYDLSFFDSDPFEPLPGGTMSIWPFFLGKFVELPYTLVQDYTLFSILRETSPRLWLEKIAFIEKYHGMALLNSHPDYLKRGAALTIYQEFLLALKNRKVYWHALPREVATWWRARAQGASTPSAEPMRRNLVRLREGNVELIQD